MSWLRTYTIICTTVLGLVVLALILLVSFVDLGLSTNGTIALFIGALATVLLTMVLMGLIFISDRAGRDASVYEARQEKSAEKKTHSRYATQDRGSR